MTPGPLDAIERAVADALANTLPGVVDRLAETAGPRAYAVAQVAERLEVSDQTVYRLIKDGHLATVPHLSPTRIAAAALDEFLAGKR
ncbi:MAG TPA: helix-turn-helix domain-containing protein [Acidimicrobiales bacterium]|jgi:excisionase family DNA binding protein